jgi:hypothetical protein
MFDVLDANTTALNSTTLRSSMKINIFKIQQLQFETMSLLPFSIFITNFYKDTALHYFSKSQLHIFKVTGYPEQSVKKQKDKKKKLTTDVKVNMTQSINNCKVSDKSIQLIFYFSSIRLHIFNKCEFFNLKITNRGQ